MRLVFLLGVLLYSGGVIGQEAQLSFEAGNVYLQNIGNQKEHQLFIKDKGAKLYAFSNGILNKGDVRKLINDRVGQLVWNSMNFFLLKHVLVNGIKEWVAVPGKKEDQKVFYQLNSSPEGIFTNNFKGKKIDLSVDSVYISSELDTVGEYLITRWVSVTLKANVSFEGSKLGVLKIDNSILDFRLESTAIDSLILKNVEFKEAYSIQSSPLPKYIRLDRVHCKDEKRLFDFTLFQIADSTKVCDLNIGPGVAGQIKANYRYFNLAFDSATSLYDKEQVYTELLNMQRSSYFLDGYEKLDKEYKAFKYDSRGSFIAKLQNRIDKYWWDYGYNKFMVILNSIYLFLLFFVINLLAYKGLSKVYHPIKFKEFDERLEMSNVEIKHPVSTSVKKYLIRIPVIFLYTAFVFWGLKLDLKELEIKKPLYMTILIGQYMVGLVCLAYIANYIISK